MEANTTIMIMLLFIAVFILTGLVVLWLSMQDIKKNFWDNRHIEVKEPIRTLDLTKRTNHGPRLKPKFRTDEKLFEIEQNPAK